MASIFPPLYYENLHTNIADNRLVIQEESINFAEN